MSVYRQDVIEGGGGVPGRGSERSSRLRLGVRLGWSGAFQKPDGPRGSCSRGVIAQYGLRAEAEIHTQVVRPSSPVGSWATVSVMGSYRTGVCRSAAHFPAARTGRVVAEDIHGVRRRDSTGRTGGEFS